MRRMNTIQMLAIFKKYYKDDSGFYANIQVSKTMEHRKN